MTKMTKTKPAKPTKAKTESPKKKKHIGWIILTAVVLVLVILWFATTPSKDLQITGRFVLGENKTVLAKWDKNEPLANDLTTVCKNLPGYDEFLPLPDGKTALVTCMDGWIWKVDMTTWTAERFVDPPLEAAGAVMSPTDDNIVYFCSSVLYGETYPEGETPGVYALNLTTKEITTVINRVPLVSYHTPDSTRTEHGYVYTNGEHSMKVSDMTDDNSMVTAFCNDMAISRDGKRMYWSEPFSYEGAAMGGGKNVYETLSLGEHGRIWCYNTETDTVSLVVDGLSFADGLLLEYPDDTSTQESSILVCETIRYCITRAHLTGSKAATAEPLWTDLPGMCDGLGYDENGNIWVGLLHARSGAVDTIYKHPWLKQILLRMPSSWFSGSKGCGLIAFDPTCSKVLYYTLYTGDNISDIPVAVGTDGKIFLPSFVKEQSGLHYIDNPLY